MLTNLGYVTVARCPNWFLTACSSESDSLKDGAECSADVQSRKDGMFRHEPVSRHSWDNRAQIGARGVPMAFRSIDHRLPRSQVFSKV